jgi:flagellar motor switch protein FliM
VEASVELGSTEISLRALLELQVGDIICLDQDSDSELLLRIEDIPKFMGLPRVIKQRKALEITSQVLPPEEEEDNE